MIERNWNELIRPEKPMIETVLGHAKGNLTHAAAMLGINRATLRTKMQQLRIKG